MEAKPNERAGGSRALRVLRAIVFGGLTWAIRLFVAFLLLLFFFKIVPTYIEFFEIQEIPLPSPTRLTVDISFRVVQYWYLGALLLLFVDGPLAIGLQFLPQRLRWIRVCWFDGYLLAAILLLMIGSIGLYLPFHEMVTHNTSASPASTSSP